MLLLTTLDSTPFLRVGVPAGAELDAHRRSGKLEGMAEESFEVALVGIGHAIERVAVDDDARRIDAPLVRVPQLGAHQAGLLRRLKIDRTYYVSSLVQLRHPLHR